MRLRLPTRQIIRDHRWLAPFCGHPRLWHFNRRGVAAGIALGIFFGLLIPIAQIPFAAGTAVLLRANVPLAIGSTLVTNPVTFAPVYIAAYYLGAVVLGEEANAKEAQSPLQPEIDTDPRWWRMAGENILGVGKPLVVGLAIVAVAGGTLSYFAIMLFWRARTIWRWKRRRGRIAGAPGRTSSTTARGGFARELHARHQRHRCLFGGAALGTAVPRGDRRHAGGEGSLGGGDTIALLVSTPDGQKRQEEDPSCRTALRVGSPGGGGRNRRYRVTPSAAT